MHCTQMILLSLHGLRKSSPLEAALIEFARLLHIQKSLVTACSQELQIDYRVSSAYTKPKISSARGPSSLT
jgi:hypothetical protein